MKIHEFTLENGSLAPVDLAIHRGALFLTRENVTRAIPAGALAAIMKRYGAPLDEGAKFREVDALELGPGERLRHIRHVDFYDVIARDYLVYEAPGREPTCAMATTVAGALEHLARAATRD
jgi:hypothetical protein